MVEEKARSSKIPGKNLIERGCIELMLERKAEKSEGSGESGESEENEE